MGRPFADEFMAPRSRSPESGEWILPRALKDWRFRSIDRNFRNVRALDKWIRVWRASYSLGLREREVVCPPEAIERRKTRDFHQSDENMYSNHAELIMYHIACIEKLESNSDSLSQRTETLDFP